MRLFMRRPAAEPRAADLARIEEKIDAILERLPTAENLMRAIARSRQPEKDRMT